MHCFVATTTEQTTTESTTTEGTTTTEGSTTTESSTTEGTTESTTTTSPPPSGGNSSCPETKPDQGVYVCPSSFRQDPKDCNQFYQCTQNDDSDDMTITKFTCPPNTSYDDKQCKCVKSDNCPNDSSRSLKYLIDPRNMVNYEKVIMH